MNIINSYKESLSLVCCGCGCGCGIVPNTNMEGSKDKVKYQRKRKRNRLEWRIQQWACHVHACYMATTVEKRREGHK